MLLVLLAAAVIVAALGDADGEEAAGSQWETLRIDLRHTLGEGDERMEVHRVSREPFWAGAPRHSIDRREMGEYRLEVFSCADGTLIFRRGFSTLASEWLTTAISRDGEQEFEATLEFPLPTDSVDVALHRRTPQGEMTELFSMCVAPAESTWAPRPGGRTPDRTAIDLQISGSPAEKVDVVLLGDGYTIGEQSKFVADCRRFVRNLFSASPYRERRDAFNLRAVFVPSRESGVDEPRKGIDRDTAFDMSFNTLDLSRYCMSGSLWRIHDVASAVPHDVIVIIVNTSRYGGGAIYNHYTVVASDNEYDEYLAIHEFGHGFAGLADEYFVSSMAYNDFYPRGVEPWEPNITALLDSDRLKWGPLVAPDTPIPTPNDGRYGGRIGAFEGAGYAAKGLYRPAMDCIMFSKGHTGFCAVCRKAIVDMIEWYAP